MPCYHPLTAYRHKGGRIDGKWSVTFNRANAYTDLPVQLPCGQCIGCRLEKSRQWALRCTHEIKQHDQNCFITLTFDDEHLDPDQTLVKADFQNFMKRLRKNTSQKIRYYHCGEYGDQLGRPHHHAILFGYDFPDKKYFKNSKKHKLFSSDILDKAWQNQGHTLIGEANFETAAYCARYIMKKVTGMPAADHYGNKLPEYNTMSRRPGIGRDYYDKYKHEIYPDDFVVSRGQKMTPPKFYDNLLYQDNPEQFEAIKGHRIQNIKKYDDYDDYTRLPIKEEIQYAKMGMKERPLH